MNESEPDELHFSPNVYLKLSTHIAEDLHPFPEDGDLSHVSCRVCKARVIFHNLSASSPVPFPWPLTMHLGPSKGLGETR